MNSVIPSAQRKLISNKANPLNFNVDVATALLQATPEEQDQLVGTYAQTTNDRIILEFMGGLGLIPSGMNLSDLDPALKANVKQICTNVKKLVQDAVNEINWDPSIKAYTGEVITHAFEADPIKTLTIAMLMDAGHKFHKYCAEVDGACVTFRTVGHAPESTYGCTGHDSEVIYLEDQVVGCAKATAAAFGARLLTQEEFDRAYGFCKASKSLNNYGHMMKRPIWLEQNKEDIRDNLYPYGYTSRRSDRRIELKVGRQDGHNTYGWNAAVEVNPGGRLGADSR